ncbi:ATP-binding cassette domain-containing protein, partial [bacterium]|nr:ATP-binding cassette domain-containing protein [bacterium]
NRFRAKNTKAAQAQSRMKQLEKIERIDIAEDTPVVSIPMPQTPRGSKDAIRLEGVGHCYGDFRALHPVDAAIFREDRICIWGPNGAGKSTLVGLLAKTLTPTDGKVEWGINSRVAYFSQQQAELQESTRSVLDELAAVAPPEMQANLRDVLAPFLFRGEDVFKSVSVLSGGEKSRLALAKLLVHPCNVLLLDGPLNHLDIRTVETLEATLKEFTGAIVFVSHDRFFADRLAQQIWEMEAGRLKTYKGDFSDYQYAKRMQQEQESVEVNVTTVEKDEVTQRQLRKEQKRREAEERNKRSAARREQRMQYEAVETEIHEVEDEMKTLEEKMASSEFVKKADEMRAAKQRYDYLLGRKDVLYAQWEDMVEQMEG